MAIEDEYTADIKTLIQAGFAYKTRTYKPLQNALNDKRFHAYVKAVYFLLAEGGFLQIGLQKLENELISAIGGIQNLKPALAYFSAWSERAKPSASSSPSPGTFKGVLHKVLLASQTTHGFRVAHDVTIAPLTMPDDFANVREFKKLQELAQHFKDVAANPEHGEFTPQIQWYILSEQWDESVTWMAKLCHKDADVAGREMGEPYANAAQFMADVGKSGLAGVGLWPMLFDRVKSHLNGVYLITTDLKQVSVEGRCPETLNAYMRHENCNTPVLTGFLRARYRKRVTEAELSGQVDSDDKPMFDYLKKKLSQGAIEHNTIGYIATKAKKL